MSDEPTAENQTAGDMPEGPAGAADEQQAAGETTEQVPSAPAAQEQPAARADEQPAAEQARAEPSPEPGEQLTPEKPQAVPAGADAGPASSPAEAAAAAEGAPVEEDEDEVEPAPQQPRIKPEVPGMHLEVDIVPEGTDPLGRGEPEDPYATDPYAPLEEEAPPQPAAEEETAEEPISGAVIDLAAGARYRATGKRKTAVARVILKPGDGSYLVNGRTLEDHVPRATLQRNIRQALETVGLHERMDVIARVHGGGISAQAGALRHGVARALIEADPALRGELKRRGFLTRDARVKERKKAGLKKARKRPQFSKR